jgi:hypothetical protein
VLAAFHSKFPLWGMSNAESESWITECDHDGHKFFEQLLGMEFMNQSNLTLCTGVTLC